MIVFSKSAGKLVSNLIRNFSGHNKWSKIKHTKELLDKEKSNLFSKLSREIAVAVTSGGTDPKVNYRLLTAIQHAKSLNMPKSVVDRILEKYSSQKSEYEEVLYEGYGSNGVAFMIETETDNKKRMAPTLRHIFSKYNGKLDKNGAVSWLFTKRPTLRVSKEAIPDFDKFMEIAIEVGADDVEEYIEGYYDVYTSPQELISVQKEIEKKNINFEFSGFAYFPNETIEVPESGVSMIEDLIDTLTGDESVQRITHNASNISQYYM